MPDRIIGKFTATNYRKKTTRLKETRLHVGSVKNEQTGAVISSAIQLYVPLPTDVGHLAGIFLTLSNSSGACFTRITPDDLKSIISWLHDQEEELLAAHELAAKRAILLTEIDKGQAQHLEQSMEKQESTISTAFSDEIAYSHILSQKPFAN